MRGSVDDVTTGSAAATRGVRPRGAGDYVAVSADRKAAMERTASAACRP